MNAPITPPSKRIVSPGQRSRCASVAAKSGIPTPANTTCPSLSCRALRMVSSSAAVQLCFSSIVDAFPGARRLEQFFDSDQGQKVTPRFRSINETVHVLLHAFDRIAIHQRHVILQVAEQ